MGRFEIGDVLGRGPRGEVFRSRGTSGEPVAVKVVARHVASRGGFMAAFERETASLMALAQRNVVRTLDRGVDGSDFYVVQELFDGGSIRTLLRKAPIDHARVVAIGAGICDALDYCHRRALVHRHVVAENVFVDASDVARVGDFGWSLVNGQAPADAEGSAQGDLFDAAALLYELLAGKPPASPASCAGFDSKTTDFFNRALAKDPRARFTRASEMSLALALMQKGAPRATADEKRASVTIASKEGTATLKLEAGATAGDVEPALQSIAKTFAGRRFRIAYDLSNLPLMDHALKEALIRWHDKNRSALSHVAFCSPRSTIRASTLLIGRATTALPSRVFAAPEPMHAWIDRGGDS
jgi:serine/threonine protein kinase